MITTVKYLQNVLMENMGTELGLETGYVADIERRKQKFLAL